MEMKCRYSSTNIMVDWLTCLLRIREVPESGYGGFYQSLRVNTGIKIKKINPWRYRL
jgi:hypothetical protein